MLTQILKVWGNPSSWSIWQSPGSSLVYLFCLFFYQIIFTLSLKTFHSKAFYTAWMLWWLLYCMCWRIKGLSGLWKTSSLGKDYRHTSGKFLSTRWSYRWEGKKVYTEIYPATTRQRLKWKLASGHPFSDQLPWKCFAWAPINMRMSLIPMFPWTRKMWF